MYLFIYFHNMCARKCVHAHTEITFNISYIYAYTRAWLVKQKVQATYVTGCSQDELVGLWWKQPLATRQSGLVRSEGDSKSIETYVHTSVFFIVFNLSDFRFREFLLTASIEQFLSCTYRGFIVK